MIASSSSNEYKKTTKPPRQIAGELGVQYLLVGKVRWEKRQGGPSRVRVSPELVEVATISTRWQQPFDAVLTDVFEVQATIATQVAQALGLVLEHDERARMAAKPTSSLPAWDAYLQGNEAMHGFETPADLMRAIGPLERAVALDPGFGLAWAQLSASTPGSTCMLPSAVRRRRPGGLKNPSLSLPTPPPRTSLSPSTAGRSSRTGRPPWRSSRWRWPGLRWTPSC